MDRDTLIGLCATLVIAQNWLDQADLREAGRLLNAAVVEIHREVGWTAEELMLMGDVQWWLVREAEG